MAAPTDYTPLKNASGRPIPAGGMFRVTGIDPDTGAFLIDAPDEDGDPAAGVVGDCMVPVGGTGKGHWDPRAVGAFNRQDGAPAPGEQWGVQAGSFLLRKGFAGFEVLAGYGLGLVNVVRTYREEAGGSGSGRSAGRSAGGNSGSGGTRCSGTVYSTVRYRYVRAGDALVEVSQLETLAYDSTGCLVATVGESSSDFVGCIPCEGGGGSAPSGSASGEFDECGDCARAVFLPSVTVTFIEQGGASVGIPNEGGNYCCGPVPPGRAFAPWTHVAFHPCVTPGPWQFTLDNTHTGVTETVLLTMESCDPLILTGTCSLGKIVVTE